MFASAYDVCAYAPARQVRVCVCARFAWEGFQGKEFGTACPNELPKMRTSEIQLDLAEETLNMVRTSPKCVGHSQGKLKKDNGNCLSLQTWYLLEGIYWLPWCSSCLFPESLDSLHDMQHPNSLRCILETILAKWKEGLPLTSMNDTELRSGLKCSQTPTSPAELHILIKSYEILWDLMTFYAQRICLWDVAS